MFLLTFVVFSAVVVLGVWHVLNEPKISMSFRPRGRVLVLRRLVPVRTGTTLPVLTVPLRRTRILGRQLTRSYLDPR